MHPTFRSIVSACLVMIGAGIISCREYTCHDTATCPPEPDSGVSPETDERHSSTMVAESAPLPTSTLSVAPTEESSSLATPSPSFTDVSTVTTSPISASGVTIETTDEGSSDGTLTDAASEDTTNAGPAPEPCDESPCENGGTCRNVDETFDCLCRAGYTGHLWEVEKDECEAEPCASRGVCVDEVAGYSCICPSDLSGKNCELPRFERLPSGFVPLDMNVDGSVLIGSDGRHASKYTAGAVQNLGAYLGDSDSEARAVSDDGRVVVGVSWHEDLESGVRVERAVHWVGSSLSELAKPSFDSNCRATSVSGDGSVVFGDCHNGARNRLYIVRWVDGVVEELGTVAESDWCSAAVASRNGDRVFATCSITSYYQPMMWTAAGGAVLLATPLNGCRFADVALDGTSGAGTCASGGASARAFFWTERDGFQPFTGDQLLDAEALPVASGYSISADGRYIVGEDSIGTSQYAVRWEGTRSPKLVGELATAAGIGPFVWGTGRAVSVSGDGATIVGVGQVDSASSYWVVRL